jgi:hypothetical protein
MGCGFDVTICDIKRDSHEIKMAKALPVMTADAIEAKIHFVRGQRVMLDSDLAAIYGVPTMRLNEQVRRNRKKFPTDFAFQLKHQEFACLISQIAISNRGRGGRRKLPWVSTVMKEQALPYRIRRQNLNHA